MALVDVVISILLAIIVFGAGWYVLQRVTALLRAFISRMEVMSQHTDALINLFYTLMFLEVIGLALLSVGDLGAIGGEGAPSFYVGDIGNVISAVASSAFALILPVVVLYLAYTMFRQAPAQSRI